MNHRALFFLSLSTAFLGCEADTLSIVRPQRIPVPIVSPTPSPTAVPTPSPTADPTPSPTPPPPVTDLCDPHWTELTSFESPDTRAAAGWVNLGAPNRLDAFSIDMSNVDVMGTPNWVPACGAQAIDLSGWDAAKISVDVPTVPGATYRLRYLLATNPDYGTGPMGPKTLEIYWDHRLVDTQHPDPAGHTFRSMGWTLMTLDLIALSPVTQLAFQSGDHSNSGPALDRITLDRL